MNRALVILLLVATVSAQQTVRPNVASDKTAFRRAIKLERSQQTDEAIQIYEDLLEVNPKNSQAYTQLKSLLRRLKKYQELEILIQSRLEVYPQDIQSMAERGEVFLLMGNESAAVDHWEQIVAENQSSKTGFRVGKTEWINWSHMEEKRLVRRTYFLSNWQDSTPGNRILTMQLSNTSRIYNTILNNSSPSLGRYSACQTTGKVTTQLRRN